MKICFVSLSSYFYFNDSVETLTGGAQRQIFLLSQEMKTEHDLHIIVGDYGQSKFETRKGVNLHRSYSPGKKGLVREIKKMKTLYDNLKYIQPDVCVYRGYPKKALAIFYICQLLNIPFVYNLSNDSNVDEDITKLPAPSRLLFINSLGNMENIISQTQYQKTELAKRYDISSMVVPNGYHTDTRENIDLTNREGFLWIGRLNEEQKRPHICLELARKKPGVNFTLIGPKGSDDDYSSAIISRSDSMNNVSYLGQVSPQNIHKYYNRHIALINTSRYEGFPNTFLEAWRYATPVISLSVDLNKFGTFGEYYCEDDIKQMLSAIDELRENPSKRKQIGRKYRKEFAEKYSIKKSSQEYLKVLEGSRQ